MINGEAGHNTKDTGRIFLTSSREPNTTSSTPCSGIPLRDA